MKRYDGRERVVDGPVTKNYGVHTSFTKSLNKRKDKMKIKNFFLDLPPKIHMEIWRDVW